MVTNYSFRDLTPNDVEVRVAMVRENGVSLLIYKDARVDQAILDETLGQLNWKKSYRVVKDNLYCTIEIWDSDKSQWVAKEDCGVESNTEKEKGEASDAQKRAGFCWGIGRELYSAPFIWVSSDRCRIEVRGKDSYVCKDKFSVSVMKVENKKITDLQIINESSGELVYSMNKTGKPAASRSKASASSPARQETPAATRKSAPVRSEAIPAGKKMSVEEALKFEVPSKSGNRMVSLGNTLKLCTTKEKQDGFMEWLKTEVKKKSSNSEACLIIYQALRNKEVSFA